MKPMYGVIVLYKVSLSKPDLPHRIIAHVGRQPDEDFMAGVHGEVHWNFEFPHAAIQGAESLFESPLLMPSFT